MTGLAAAVLAGGISQLASAVVPATLTALVIAAPIALAGLWLRRRSRRVPFPREHEHEDTQEIDVPDFIREPKHAAPKRSPRPYPRDDSGFVADGMADALRWMTEEGDERG